MGRAHTLARPSGCLRQCSLRGFASSVHVLGEPPSGLAKEDRALLFLYRSACSLPYGSRTPARGGYASLLVFTSPMTSPLAFLRHCYCVNVTGSVVPTEDYSVGITTRKHFARLPPLEVTTSAVYSGTKCRNAAANSRWYCPCRCSRDAKRGSTCRSHCRCRTATQRAAANCTRNGSGNRCAASGYANARTNDSSNGATDSCTNGSDCRESTR